jgi:uncharacterized protein
MEKSPLKKYVPDMSWMDNYPVLRPLHRRFADHALWALNRRSVSRGVGLGVFFGILTPVAQILFASIAAIALRANLPIAAVSTLVSNPFTFPLIFIFAYRIGSSMTGDSDDDIGDIAISEEAAEYALDPVGWFPTLLNWISSVGPPLMIGLFVIALCASLTAFAIVNLFWRWISQIRHHG